MSLSLVGLALASEGESEGFHAPSPEEFYWPIFGSGDWTFTRPMLMMALSVLILGVLLVTLTKKAAIVPGKGQWMVEQAYDFVRNGIARDIIGSKDFLKYTPLLFSLFTLILLNNLFGIIPPIQYPTMSRIGFPIALTLIVYAVYHIAGMRRKGVGHYLSGMIPKGLPKPIYALIIPLEYATYFIIRPLTLALRLFGNMFAGHMLLLLFIMGGEYMLLHGGPGLKVVSVGSFLMALIFTAFEALIQFLQAYIFTLLAATYISDAISEEH
ncbi:F0F1 ATP synthase subunit A [Nostocoides australiense]|uniref:F0F1 ATP synthase subunit A n=1 Tax=Nostocoides australiense TaxID=99480 RepID=UPI000A60B3E4|nr:F0F1 ATP synthase subunit A [Tetrasphaera australiensis]MCA0290439.1 F0F1 ATP synthase subunit A [Actinomycetota bacterium]HRW02361.1 F0F1 ATP synthase subunit A [Tetrasphaera sp.]